MTMQTILRSWLLAVCSLTLLPAAAQQTAETAPRANEKTLRNKLFYLPVQLEAHAALKKDAVWQQLGRTYQQRVKQARKDCKNAACYAAALKLRPEEVLQAGNSLVTHDMKKVVQAIRTAGYYNKDTTLSDTALLRFAWQQTAMELNYIFDTYLAGKRPRYAGIDSVSFNVNTPAFIAQVEKLLDKQPAGSYYTLPVSLAMNVLLLNGRDEAARYEPLTAGQNAKAYARIAGTTWDKYPYSALLVPGFGPDKPGVRLDYRGVERCKMAAERFNRKMAPFIIVSGGHVYPHRTPYSEAVEMKRYLMQEFKIPEAAIIIEPHARHTTTNMRNAGRLMYRFHMPLNKPGLVITDAAQMLMIANLDERCMRELGIVPYRDVKVLGKNEASFYPVAHSFFINVFDVLDP